MSIQSQISRINTNIANAYSAVTTMGGTVPQTQNSANLPAAIATLAQTDYIQLEWIESSGTQWINTGLNCTTIGKIQTSYNFSSLNSGWKAVMLGETAGNNDYPGLGILAKSSQHRFEYGTYNSSYTQSSVSANTVYTVDLDGINNQITINNTTYNTNFDRTLPNTNLTLFVTDGDTGGYYYGSGVRMYYCKLYNLSGELVRDFIPVMRKSDCEVGLYDKVSKTFFGNSGSGAFKPGIKIAGYNILDYIQGTGSQYIDTGVKGNQNTGIESEFQFTSLSPKQQRLFGVHQNSGSTDVSMELYLNGSSPTMFAYVHNTGTTGNYTGTGYYATTNVTTVKYNLNNDGKIVLLEGATQKYNATMNGTINSTSTSNLPIFCNIVNNTTYENYAYVKVFRFKIYDNTVIIRDYIPVQRVSDSKNGLYDLVNKVFYPSATNTNFTAGTNLLSDDGTNSPEISIIDVPSPSSYSGSIANQILRIEENIANSYYVCQQLGRTMPPVENSYYLEPTILAQAFTTFTVTFENYDGTVLQTGQYYYGQTPVYSGTTPTKPSDVTYDYNFDGWSSPISLVTSNQTYTAQFITVYHNYTIQWKNYDNSVLETDLCHYGDTPTYNGATPTRAYDGYTYTFDGWSPTVSTVTQNQDYVAQYTHSYVTDTAMYYKEEYEYPGYTVHLRNSPATGYSEVEGFSNFNDRYWGSEVTKIVFDTPIVPPSTPYTQPPNFYLSYWFTSGIREIVGISNLKTDNITSFSGLFMDCSNLTSIDISSWNASSLRASGNNPSVITNLFTRCSSLTYLDVSNIDFTQFNYAAGLSSSMFTGCAHVQTAYCKDAANKAILDNLVANVPDVTYSWRFTVKS